MLMHNLTLHGTTGIAPTQLMFNRIIRDKIPGIDELNKQFTDPACKKKKGRKQQIKRDELRRSILRLAIKCWYKT